MLALPALSANGLFKSLEMFNFEEKYYRIVDIFTSVAFMVLSRIDTINQLDSISAGEWGRLMGLDRIPEKKCLRAKLDELSSLDNETNLDEWISERSIDWIQPDEGACITFDVQHTYVGASLYQNKFLHDHQDKNYL
jgi:hypothetical protein